MKLLICFNHRKMYSTVLCIFLMTSWCIQVIINSNLLCKFLGPLSDWVNFFYYCHLRNTILLSFEILKLKISIFICAWLAMLLHLTNLNYLGCSVSTDYKTSHSYLMHNIHRSTYFRPSMIDGVEYIKLLNRLAVFPREIKQII